MESMGFKIEGVYSSDYSQFSVENKKKPSPETIDLALKVAGKTGNFFRWLIGGLGLGTQWERLQTSQQGRSKIIYVSRESIQKALQKISSSSAGDIELKKGYGALLATMVATERNKPTAIISREDIAVPKEQGIPSPSRLKKFGLQYPQGAESAITLDQLVEANEDTLFSIPSDITQNEASFVLQFLDKQKERKASKLAAPAQEFLTALSSKIDFKNRRVKNGCFEYFCQCLTGITENKSTPNEIKISALKKLQRTITSLIDIQLQKIMKMRQDHDEKSKSSAQEALELSAEAIGVENDYFAFLSTILDTTKTAIEKLESPPI
jgi:hypothetical protein